MAKSKSKSVNNISDDPVSDAEQQRHLVLLQKVRKEQTLTASEVAELKYLEHKNKKPDTNGQKKQRGARIADEEVIDTQADAAKYIGKTPRTLRRWERMGMLTAMRDSKKVYIKSQLLAFSLSDGKQPSKHRERRDESDADFRAVKAELAQMELDEKKGLLVSRLDVERANIDKIQAVKRALLAQPRKLARRLAGVSEPRKIESIISRENRKIIEDFSR